MKVPEKLLDALEKVTTLLKGLSQKQYYALFGGMLLAFFLLDYFVVMGPQLRALTDVSTKIQSKQDDLTRTQNDILRLNNFRKQTEGLKKEVSRLGNKVRPRQEVSQILERITLIGSQSSIIIDQIMPKVLDEELLLETKEKKYYSLPISIEARCGYHDFGRFLNDIENDGIFFSIISFSVRSVNNSTDNRIKLIIRTVIYEDNKGEDKDA